MHTRDGEQVPDTEERAREQHEEEATGDEGSRNVLAASLSRNSVRHDLFYQLILISNDFRSLPWKDHQFGPYASFTNGPKKQANDSKRPLAMTKVSSSHRALLENGRHEEDTATRPAV